MKTFIEYTKGISWIKPKEVLNRFIMVVIFTGALTLMAQLIQIFGSFFVKLLGV